MNRPLKDYSDFGLMPYLPAEDYKSVATIGIPKVLPKEREEAFAALRYMQTLKDGWNGYGAKAPTTGSLEASIGFFTAFPFGKQYPHKIMPDGEGAVMLIWLASDYRFTITVEAALLHLSIERIDGKNEFPDSIAYDMGNVPSDILRHIPAMTIK